MPTVGQSAVPATLAGGFNTNTNTVIPNHAQSMPTVSASDTDGGNILAVTSRTSSHPNKRMKTGAPAVAVANNSSDGELLSRVVNLDSADYPLTEEERIQHNRERNREHAKNTRLRKKAYVERLKISVDSLCCERDGLLAERAAAAERLVEIHSKRVDVMRSFFALRASYSVDQKRELWSGILDENSFTCRLPVTPYQSFPISELQGSNCQRVIVGVDGMIRDAAANYVFLNSLVDRSRYPNAKIRFQYTLVSEDSPAFGGGVTPVGNNVLMARWSMATLNAQKLGLSSSDDSSDDDLTELSQRGMVMCRFNSAHKILSIEIMFDVMAFMLQVKRAFGFDNFNDVAIPNTVQACSSQDREYDYPMVMTLANRPYTIVQVNGRWENLTGYSREEVIGKKSCSILQQQKQEGAKRNMHKHSDVKELDTLMGPVLFQRPSCAMLTNYTKTGRRYRQYITIYPLSTDSNITHYFGLTTFVQWMDWDTAAVIPKSRQDTTQSATDACVQQEVGKNNNKHRTVEFAEPLTTLKTLHTEAPPTTEEVTQGADDALLGNNSRLIKKDTSEEAPTQKISSENSRAKKNTDSEKSPGGI